MYGLRRFEEFMAGLRVGAVVVSHVIDAGRSRDAVFNDAWTTVTVTLAGRSIDRV